MLLGLIYFMIFFILRFYLIVFNKKSDTLCFFSLGSLYLVRLDNWIWFFLLLLSILT